MAFLKTETNQRAEGEQQGEVDHIFDSQISHNFLLLNPYNNHSFQNDAHPQQNQNFEQYFPIPNQTQTQQQPLQSTSIPNFYLSNPANLNLHHFSSAISQATSTKHSSFSNSENPWLKHEPNVSKPRPSPPPSYVSQTFSYSHSHEYFSNSNPSQNISNPYANPRKNYLNNLKNEHKNENEHNNEHKNNSKEQKNNMKQNNHQSNIKFFDSTYTTEQMPEKFISPQSLKEIDLIEIIKKLLQDKNSEEWIYYREIYKFLCDEFPNDVANIIPTLNHLICMEENEQFIKKLNKLGTKSCQIKIIRERNLKKTEIGKILQV